MSTLRAYITGFALGSLIATAITLLFAPYSGEDTRQLLKERKEELRSKAQEFVRETQENANQMLAGKTKDAIDEASKVLNHGQEFLDVTRQKVTS